MKQTILFALLFTIVGLQSCQKWLDVQPEDKFIEDQIFTNPTTFAEALNGIYLEIGSSKLYGETLTLSTLDLFAQLYYGGPSSTYTYYNYGALNYDQDNIKSKLKATWTSMYVTIGNINQFLKNLEIHKDVLSQSQYEQYKGEALGLRAFLHFDLYRMFSPAFSSTEPYLETIPYYTSLSLNIEPFRTQESLVQQLLDDVEQAEYYLQGDPIISELGTTNQNSYRFNYFAALALKARIYYYTKNDSEAYKAAYKIISQDSKFPWINHSLATGGAGYTDRIFYSENIFAVYNSKLYDRYTALFSGSSNSNQTVLSTGPEDYVNQIYENNMADYRYVYSWATSQTGGVTHKVFNKYSPIVDPVNTVVYSKFAVPVFKKSEMYLIASQTAANPTEALSLLNQVRRARNIPTDIINYSDYSSELAKEYRKEFFGEGQLFYFYKRNGVTVIPSPNSLAGTMTVSIGKYVLPIPEDEYTGR